MILSIIGELLLYVSFSILMGWLICALLPSHRRPDIHLSNGMLILVVIGIGIGTFMQPFQLVLAFYKELGVLVAIESVFLTFIVGKAWLLTCCTMMVLYPWIRKYLLLQKTEYKYAVIVGVCILILSIGWASHATSLVGISGLFAHSLHFTAVTSWIGILFVSSWFSKTWSGWTSFLHWYTPFAIASLLITMGTGLYIMNLVLAFDDYINAWQLNYGQVLLIKHLLLVPLFIFALINGIFIRKHLKVNPNFEPVGWFRGESLVAILIFTATSMLGKTSPPHDIATTVEVEGQSTIFSIFHHGESMIMNLGITVNGMSLFGLSILFSIIALLGFKKGMTWVFSFVFALLSGVTFYVGLMESLI